MQSTSIWAPGGSILIFSSGKGRGKGRGPPVILQIWHQWDLLAFHDSNDLYSRRMQRVHDEVSETAAGLRRSHL